jgi:hypothetical protein
MSLPISKNEHGCDTKYNIDITLLNIKSCPLQHIGQPYSSQKRQAEKEKRGCHQRQDSNNTTQAVTLHLMQSYLQKYLLPLCLQLAALMEFLQKLLQGKGKVQAKLLVMLKLLHHPSPFPSSWQNKDMC